MRQIVIFDFDGTVIRGDSVVALLFAARKERLISLGGLCAAAAFGVLYHLKLTDALTAKRRSHAFLTRLPAETREAFLRRFAESLVGRAYPDALRRMRQHQAQGETVVLCSASCQCYMRYVAERLPVDALLCTPCADDGHVIGPNCRGAEKVRRVQVWLEEQQLAPGEIAAAYGDSRGDAPILRLSHQPVLVNAKRGLIRALPEAERVAWKE